MQGDRFRPLRRVALGEDRERRYDRWLARLDEELSDPGTDRNQLCRRVLEEIYPPLTSRILARHR